MQRGCIEFWLGIRVILVARLKQKYCSYINELYVFDLNTMCLFDVFNIAHFLFCKSIKVTTHCILSILVWKI